VVIDLGAGDGRAVLRRARREPDTLAIAIEPVAAAAAEASRRAARPATRGGLPNALFLAGSAEELPWLLRGRADQVIVALPWGALLDGVLNPSGGTAERVAQTLRPRGELTLLLSLVAGDRRASDHLLDDVALPQLVAGYGAIGFECVELRPATAIDVTELSGSWGRRLGIPDRRPGHLLRLQVSSVGEPPQPGSGPPRPDRK
jgi:hypothetical protein